MSTFGEFEIDIEIEGLTIVVEGGTGDGDIYGGSAVSNFGGGFDVISGGNAGSVFDDDDIIDGGSA